MSLFAFGVVGIVAIVLCWLLAIATAALFFTVQFGPLVIGATLLFLILSLSLVYAFVASIQAWRSATIGNARTRAKIFALAFGVRDLCWGFVYADGIYSVLPGRYLTEPVPDYS